MSLLKSALKRSFQTSFKLNSQNNTLLNTTRRFQSSYSRNFNYGKSYTKPVVALGFLSWLFGSSVDYNAVRNDIVEVLEDYDWDDSSWGPVLVRLAWHASGTYDKSDNSGGSNGATMRFSTEANDGANAGLEHARKRLEALKKKYPGLSYGDLWILASYVAIEEMGGPKIEFRGGRVDKNSNSDCPPNGRLPDAALGAQHVRDIYYRMGFNDQEIVALVGGGHSIGRCHTDRSGYDGPWTRAPTTISNLYFQMLLDEKWTERKWNGPRQFQNEAKDLMMLPADMALKTDPSFRKWVDVYYKDEERFLRDFGAAFKKLTELGF